MKEKRSQSTSTKQRSRNRLATGAVATLAGDTAARRSRPRRSALVDCACFCWRFRFDSPTSNIAIRVRVIDESNTNKQAKKCVNIPRSRKTGEKSVNIPRSLKWHPQTEV